MKKGHKYALNPVGFAGIVANPKGRSKRKTKKRNPNRAKGKPGMWIVRKAKKNPAKPAPAPVKRAKRKPRRKPRAKAVAPVKKISQSTNKTMSKTKRRGKGRSRNPSRRGKARRAARSSARRNPSRRGKRRMGRRSRNPAQIASYGRELFSSDMLSVAGGVVLSGLGTTMILNQAFKTDPTTGKRMFDLPLIDYTPLASPATAGTFYSKNVWPIAFYKVLIGGGAAFLLRNQSPRLSRGLAIGTVAGVVSDVLKGTGMLKANGTLALPSTNGAGRNYPAANGAGRGMRTYVPGVPTIFTGQGSAFLAPRGAGARVDGKFMTRLPAMVENPFAG